MSALRRFVFIAHPPSARDLFRIKELKPLSILPEEWVERMVGGLGPYPLFRRRGIVSPSGVEAEEIAMGLLATPRLMLGRPPEATYRLLVKAARMGAREGATVMGLGAFTSVVGDAGETVAERSPIPVTTGNGLTVAATLASLDALAEVSQVPLAEEEVAVVGGTGSIGYAVARCLAKSVKGLRIVGRNAAKAERLAADLPGPVTYAGADAAVGLAGARRVVGATSSGGRAIPMAALEPGAAVLDLALPPDVPKSAAEDRPDCLFIEAGEMVLPGRPEPEFDWPLKGGLAYACEAETALIALSGETDLCTLGRDIRPERVARLWDLAVENGFEWAGFRSFGRPLEREQVASRVRPARPGAGAAFTS